MDFLGPVKTDKFDEVEPDKKFFILVIRMSSQSGQKYAFTSTFQHYERVRKSKKFGWRR